MDIHPPTKPILNEIRDNKRAVDEGFARVVRNEQSLEKVLEITSRLLTHGKHSDVDMELSVSGPSLDSASWTTAASAGALAYTGYAEVKRLADAYRLQDLLVRVQNERIQTVASAIAQTKNPAFPHRLTDQQPRDFERDLLTCLAQVSMWNQIARLLSAGYGQALAGK